MTRSALRVLVTAVGGDLGQALVKALRLYPEPIEIHGCDVDASGLGGAFVDQCHVIPHAGDTTVYLEALDDLCQSYKIQVVLPASEPEIYALSRLGSSPHLSCGAIVVCQGEKWIDTYGDKLNCMRTLAGNVELAPFADGRDPEAVDRLVADLGFPIVVKARRSSGSRTLRVANNRQELSTYLEEIELPFAQQYLGIDENEFSVAVFACKSFEAIICFKRQLGPGGCSWFAENLDDQEILEYARQIAHVTHLVGSANVQVRKTQTGVRLLEINPRFSSLAAARAFCGFRDVEWSVKMALGLEIGPPPQYYRHIRFQRFLHEMVDSGDGFQAVAEWSPKHLAMVGLDREFNK